MYGSERIKLINRIVKLTYTTTKIRNCFIESKKLKIKKGCQLKNYTYHFLNFFFLIESCKIKKNISSGLVKVLGVVLHIFNKIRKELNLLK